jgi:hypothetical protein
MAIDRLWLCVCLAWAVLGGTMLYFLDHSLVEPVVWLAAGGLIGCFGPAILWRFVQVLPHRGEVPPCDPQFMAPVAGLVHGTLLGTQAGTVVGFESEGEAWQGVLLGALVVPPVLSLALLIVSTVFPVKAGGAGPLEEGRFGLTRRHRVLLVLVCIALPVVTLAALVRCLLWAVRRPKRLRVYARVQELGGIFGADPDGDMFYGVRWEGPAIGDADVQQLRVFPELDCLTVSGTRVTDAGLARLRGLRRLKIVGLARTAITDAGLAHLTGLAELRILDVSETRVGDAGLECLHCLTNLKYLDLRGSQVTVAGVARLHKALPQAEVVWNGKP